MKIVTFNFDIYGLDSIIKKESRWMKKQESWKSHRFLFEEIGEKEELATFSIICRFAEWFISMYTFNVFLVWSF